MASSEEIVVISLVDKEIKDSMEIGEEVVLEEDQVVIEVKGRTGATNGIREAQIMVDSVVTSLEEEKEAVGHSANLQLFFTILVLILGFSILQTI